MPSIADQVATIEHDLVDALARCDALTAANEALATQNKAVLSENVTLSDKAVDMQKLVNDTRAAADQLAQAALHLLRTSRRTLDGEVLTPMKTLEDVVEHNKEILKDAALASRDEQVERISELAGVTSEGGPLPVHADGINRGPSPYWDAKSNLGGDSGDEQPALDPAMNDTQVLAVVQPDGSAVEAPSGVEFKMEWQGNSDGGVTLAAVGKPMLVEHTEGDEPLPIFLRHDRAPAGSAVFG